MAEFRKYLEQCEGPILESADLDAQVIHYYHHLPSIREVREKTGITYGRLYRILQRNGIKPYRRQKPTRDLVLKFHDEGLPLGQIAAITDYTARNVRNIVKEKRTI